MAEIQLIGVKKRFRDNLVIKGLDLTIKEGEFFTFVGPSGCGKSTILNMIAGLEPVSEGRILFDKEEVNNLSPRERDVAMVFQNYALYPHMTVYENIAFPLRMRKVERSTIDREVKNIARMLGLSQLLTRYPRELSGGQRQRVALGRAIIRRPRVFLMDEPLSNLDAKLRVEMRGELKKLHQSLKITTIYVTHDQGEAMGLSDRVAVLKDGELQQCGEPYEIYFHPVNTFVAEFIGSPPINLLPGKVKDIHKVEYGGHIFEVSQNIPPHVREVLIGIRPEDIIISPDHGKGIKAQVMVTESAGPFYWVDCQWEGRNIKGRASESMKPGTSCVISFPGEKIILFDADTGKRI